MFKRVDFYIAPLTLGEIKHTLKTGSISFLFDGTRGKESYNLDFIAHIIYNIALMGIENPQIKAIDINPLLVYNNDMSDVAVDFKILLNFIKEIKFDNLGVFAYSDSKDLVSHNFKNHVPEDLARQRQDIIMAQQAEISEKINEKHLGKVYKVIVEENPDNGIFLGRTSFQAPEVDGITFIYGSGLEIGSFVDVRVTETFEYDLAGEIEMP